MSAAGLELSNFINPNLTWKTASKVRNTSRRSRIPASKNLKMIQGQGKISSKRLEAPQVSDSEKVKNSPHTAVSQRRLSDNIEHIPIKKRRFLLRSPSPPPLQSPCSLKESEELHGRRCYSYRQISVDSMEQGDAEINSSSVTEPKFPVFDGITDKKIPQSTNVVRSCNEDFSGIAILADAACIDSLNNAADDARSPADEYPEQELNRSLLMTIRNESSGYIELSDPSGKEHAVVEGSLCTHLNETNSTVEVEGGSQATLSDDASKAAEKTKRSGFSSDGRFHWDLNVAMDEWGRPLDNSAVALGMNLVENNTNDTSPRQICDGQEDCDAQKDSGKLDSNDESALHHNFGRLSTCEVKSDLTDFACGMQLLSTNKSMDGPSRLERSFLKDDFPSTSSSDALETSLLSLNSGVHFQVDSKITSINHSLQLQSDDMKTWLSTDHHKTETRRSSKGEVDEDSDPGIQVAELENSSLETTVAKFMVEPCEITCWEASPSVAKKREISLLQAFGSEQAICETKMETLKGENPGEDNDSVDHENELGKVSAEPEGSCALVEKAVLSETKDVGFSYSFIAKSEDATAESSVDIVDVKEITDKSSAPDASGLLVSGSEILVHTRSEHHTADEVCTNQVHNPSNQPGKVPSVDGLDGDPDSHASLDGRCHAGNDLDLEVGYDSHLEDGELREPAGIFWEENEGDEAEHVDYDSDNRDGYECTTDAGNDYQPQLGKVLVGVGGERRSQSDQCGYKDDQPTSEKSTGENSSRSCPGSMSTADNGYLRRKSSTSSTCLIAPFSRMDGFEGVEMGIKAGVKSGAGSDDLNTGGTENVNEVENETIGLTAARRELQSHIEGPVSSDKKDAEPMRRSRPGNFGNIYGGDERHTDANMSMDKGRTSLHVDGRDRFSNHSWNFGLKSTIANSATESDGDRIFRHSDDTSPRIRRPTIISTSKGGYPHLMRKGLPAERDEGYGMGKVKVRDISPDNVMRSRFERYPIGVNRGYREGYRRPGMYETANSPGTIRNHFGKRERSFSPIINRMDHLSQGHRRSRSRSRSRSPDFRSEARTGRMRIPYQPTNHDRVRDRRSPGRMFCQGQRFETMGSPGRLRPDDCSRPIMRPVRFSDVAPSGRNHEFEEGGEDYKRKPHLPRSHMRSRSRSSSRSPEFRSEARMGTMRVYQPRGENHIRDRRSPVRMFRPSQRFEPMDSQGRMRSDDYTRPPIMRPVRFTDAAQSGRGNEYGGDEFRRKPRKIFERIHPIRNYDMDGERRFQYDSEDANVAQGFRTADRRSGDALRNNREGRGGTRYNSDRIYYSGPKPMGMRDYGDETQPRPMRP